MTQELPRSRADQRLQRQYAVFAFLLAVGVLFHQSILSDWKPWSHHMLVSLTAICVLFRPHSLVAMLVMTAAHFVSFLIDLPFVVNHWMFVGMLDLGILIGVTRLIVQHRTIRVTGGHLYHDLAPMLRWSVVIMYTFAALAKLNWDFFSTDLSAAMSLYDSLASKVGVLPRGEWTHPIAIWGTVSLECSLPLLLLFRRTRVLGVFVAIGFHFTMGVAGFIPFSGFALAFLFLFLPDNTVDRYSLWRTRFPAALRVEAAARQLSRQRWLVLFASGLWLLIAFTRTYAWLPPAEVRMAVIRLGQLLFAVTYFGITLLLLRLLWPARREATRSMATAASTLRLTHATHAVIPCLLIANGLCPYLGLKTESSFAMYSNLQTEGDQWNHLFMPSSLRVFGWQDELVTVLESNHPPLQRAAREKIRLTWLEFHREVSQAPGISVAYEYAGGINTVPDSRNDPQLSRPPKLLWRKGLWFREVPLPEHNTIRH